MIILPAIDLKDGQPVRLRRGDFATAHPVAADAIEQAKAFEAEGARLLHLVDLDGAREGRPVWCDRVQAILRETGLAVEVGGGIRTLEAVERYLEMGVHRVVLGSIALRDPQLVEEACRRYGDRIAVGIDAKNGRVAAEGWTKTSETGYLELAAAMEQAGVRTLIFTDINRDGMLSGPNLTQLAALRGAVGCSVIASGGIRNADDIRALAGIGVDGAICGRSLYAGTLSLAEALAIGGE